MREAVLRFNEAGQFEKSKEYFNWLRENYPADLYEKGYEYFVQRQWREDQEVLQFRSAVSRINNLIVQGAQLIAYGDDDDGSAHIAYARRVYNEYQKEQVSDRNRLGPFRTIYESLVHQIGPQMRPESYERLLKRTGFKRPTTRPAATQP
jgi:hypothetical protein